MASTDQTDAAFFNYYYEDDDDFEEDEEEQFIDNTNFSETLNPNFESFPIPTESNSTNLIPIQERNLESLSSSRPLFQRLWTDEDEMVILEGFLDFVTKRGTSHANYQHDTGPFYEQIKNTINLDFNKNQLIEKLRRLKKKYRNVDNRIKSKGEGFFFKSEHEKKIYEISRKIWNNSAKRPRNVDESNGVVETEEQVPIAIEQGPNAAMGVTSVVVEETVRCCLSALLKCGCGNGGLLNCWDLGLSNGLGSLPVVGLDGEKWKQQRILELEVYLKRVELVGEQIRATLEELKSSMKTDS